jgi:hypothetical protein
VVEVAVDGRPALIFEDDLEDLMAADEAAETGAGEGLGVHVREP